MFRRTVGLVPVSILVAACAGGTPSASPEHAHDAPGGHAHGAHADFPACATLAKSCHPHDKDSDRAHACHKLGHDAPSNEECEAKRADCLAICGGGDGGV